MNKLLTLSASTKKNHYQPYGTRHLKTNKFVIFITK